MDLWAICCTTTGRSAANSLLNPSKLAAGRASSREAPQAWLFGLAFGSAPQAEQKAPQASQFGAPQAGKIMRSAGISLLFSLGFRLAATANGVVYLHTTRVSTQHLFPLPGVSIARGASSRNPEQSGEWGCRKSTGGPGPGGGHRHTKHQVPISIGCIYPHRAV